ncbi:MAG: hypothetical protein KF887_04600 [Paracoccaceae bacterium]|nr:MAG: hypothetical protein KF887_04600 [Paracoccaceae bacterium]
MRLSPLAAALAIVLASPAGAACYADYKAKQDNPLRLHYGVIEVPDSACSPGAAQQVAAQRLRSAGWTLLNVMSVFGPEGLNERKASAGEHFLRY